MQIKLLQQFLLQRNLGIVQAEQETIGQNHSSTTILFQTVHDNRHEEVSRFRRCQIGGEVILNMRLFVTTIGRVHQDHIKLVIFGVVENITDQGIIMEDFRIIQTMQQHIGNAENVGELLFFNSVCGNGIGFLVCYGFNLG